MSNVGIREGLLMKRYSVYVEFENGKDFQFETNTNVLMLQPLHINGSEMIVTEEQYCVNLVRVRKIELVEIGKGKIGEFVPR